ncbi:hypothetical protein DTL21_06425 [Bremerella cremea]|uniref:Uncharacterized protein n=1 Tax=Blastopirellula marina TaxID=124 RepID=A0A2S8FZF9_9BACT|nr:MULTISPECIES: hypothetical protein [Pirellulaceae]PQO37576.1 hypothetical protein C5Y83_06425 [Blastopirellula marina]RCS49963.1 hypothetical protein DTL21_06425 [Bremerella cremea]
MIDHQRGRQEAGLLDNLKTGLKVKRRILLGKLPTTLRAVELRRGAFRRMLEAAIIDLRGEIGLLEAAAVSECTYWVSSVAMADWILRHKLNDLSGTELSQIARQQAASMGRCRSVMAELLQDEKKASSLLEEIQRRFDAQEAIE